MRQSYQKGEVVDVDLGKPQKEVKGHEQAFYRPCVIITSFSLQLLFRVQQKNLVTAYTLM